MTKKIAKGFLFLVCIGVILFLLLPFLETENNSTQTSAQTAAEPQIFTSNPLTTLVQRLASLFRRNNPQGKQPAETTTAALTNQEVNERFGVAQYKARGSSDGDLEEERLSSATTGTVTQSASGETMYLNENGEWVLIRQITPENSTPGMHEINVKDNAYDTYVRQRAAAAANPALSTQGASVQAPKQESDSYWQKLISPVKKLFRSSEAEGVKNTGLPTDANADNAFALARADGFNPNGQNVRGKYVNTNPNFNMQGAELEATTPQKKLKDIEKVASLLNPEKAAEDMAGVMAEMEVPQRDTPEQEQKYQEAKRKHKEEISQEMKGQILEHMSQLEQNLQDQDMLKQITQNACRNDSLPGNGVDCAPRQITDPGTKQAVTAQNSQFFTTKTHISEVPLLPILPVGGVVTDPMQFQQLPPEMMEQGGLSPDVLASREILTFMSEVKDCQNSTCFAIANAIQQDPSLKDSIEMTGWTFAGDTKNYQAFEQPFVEKRLAQLGPNATDEQRQQAEQQARKDFKESAPAYVFVNGQELADIQQHLVAASRGNVSPETVVLYVMDGHDALTVANAVDSPAFFFGRGTLQTEAVSQSRQTTNDITENVVQSSQMLNDIAGRKTTAFIKNQSEQGISAINQIIKNSNGNSAEAASKINTLMQEQAQKAQEMRTRRAAANK